MIGKVLFVDDEPRVLQAYQRGLRKHFHIDGATGGEEALKRLKTDGPYPVVVSDMRMPGMNGVDLLVKIKELSPDTVRIMLTGNADQQTAVDAVNQGDVFRFLTKPCPVDVIARALAGAYKQYQLITAEKQLLRETLHGSLRALSEVLSLVNPEAFGRTNRFKRLVRDLSIAMGLADGWELEAAAMLSQIGCVVLPPELLEKVATGAPLSGEEQQRYEEHPVVGAELLAEIPRMEEVARAIRYQEKGYDGSGPPADGTAGDDIPLAARLLKVVVDFDRFDMAGLTPEESLDALKENAGRYDPRALTALDLMVSARLPMEQAKFEVPRLADGMILNEEIRTTRGILVVAKGQEITPSVRERLMSFYRHGALPRGAKISVACTDMEGAGASLEPVS